MEIKCLILMLMLLSLTDCWVDTWKYKQPIGNKWLFKDNRVKPIHGAFKDC